MTGPRATTVNIRLTDCSKMHDNRSILFFIKTGKSRLGMSVTTQGGSGRQCVTGPGRNIPKYRFVLLNVYRFWET